MVHSTQIQGPRHRASSSDSSSIPHTKPASHTTTSASARNTHHMIGLVESGSSFWVFAHRGLVMELRDGADIPMSDVVQDLSIFTGLVHDHHHALPSCICFQFQSSYLFRI
eukprot:463489_1